MKELKKFNEFYKNLKGIGFYLKFERIFLKFK